MLKIKRIAVKPSINAGDSSSSTCDSTIGPSNITTGIMHWYDAGNLLTSIKWQSLDINKAMANHRARVHRATTGGFANKPPDPKKVLAFGQFLFVWCFLVISGTNNRLCSDGVVN